MEDIAPQLLQQLQTRFSERVAASPKIRALYKRIKEGGATYADVENYAYCVGEALSQALGDILTPEALPDGRLYFNIADRVLRPLLADDHAMVQEAAAMVQASLNEKAGLAIKPQLVAVNEDRVAGIVNKVSNAEHFEDVAWVLDAPIVNFSQAVVDEMLEANVNFHAKAGLRPKIIRRAERKCCKWCESLAGVHDYPDVPEDLYRRHERCRCIVEYDPGDGKKFQNVHTKQWKTAEERARIESRKTFSPLSPSGRRYQKDIVIGRGVGAKPKNYDVLDYDSGGYFKFAEGSKIQNVEVFAGFGSRRPLWPEVAEGLAEQLGGSPDKWQHCKGNGILDCDGENRQAEVHWFQEASVGKVKFKVKRWLDED